MLPRREPFKKIDEQEAEDSCKQFHLSHYAMLLNVFAFEIELDTMLMKPERDYMNYLPLQRLKPFEKPNFYFLENKGLDDPFGIIRVNNLITQPANYFWSTSSEITNIYDNL